MNVEIGTVAAQFLFYEYLFRIFSIGPLQCAALRTILGVKKVLAPSKSPIMCFAITRNDLPHD
jgi:hypothetical protein